MHHLIYNVEPIVLLPPEVVAEVDRHHESALPSCHVRVTASGPLLLEIIQKGKVSFFPQEISVQDFHAPISSHSVNYHCHWAD